MEASQPVIASSPVDDRDHALIDAPGEWRGVRLYANDQPACCCLRNGPTRPRGPADPATVCTPGSGRAKPQRFVIAHRACDGNGWRRPGEPTIYLGSDTSVALAEFARHLEPDSPVVGGLWTVDLQLDCVVDLRNADVPPIPLSRRILAGSWTGNAAAPLRPGSGSGVPRA
jgi:hypothetical protein